jgi:hypothetical protein
MNMHLRFFVPLLLGTVFAACSPTQMVTKAPSRSVLSEQRVLCVNENLYWQRALIGDTLVLTPMTRASQAGSGQRVHVTREQAITYGIDMSEVTQIVLNSHGALDTRGDTLFLPMSSISTVTSREANPAYYVAVVVGCIALLYGVGYLFFSMSMSSIIGI